MSIQKKVLDIYSFIKENVYLCRDDVSVSGVRLNSTLLFGLLTALNGGKDLIYGEYGLGKTTSSENIISLVYGFPKEVVIATELKGNPEQTEEKIVGRPNLGMLNQGREEVIWSYFVLMGPKIIDELNRLTSSKQNVLLEGVDRGMWKYLNDLLENPSLSVFSTANYADAGNYEIIPPLLDRFDIAVESKHPGINNLRLLDFVVDQNLLVDKEISGKMMDLMDNEKDFSRLNAQLNSLRAAYRDRIGQKISLDLLTDEEIIQAKNEIGALRKMQSMDALLFNDMSMSELTTCQTFGQKRSNESCKDSCHYKDYLCSKVINCLSVRTNNSLKKYSAALAWLLGSPEVTSEHLAFVLPYAVWHKINFKKDYLEQFQEEERGPDGDPLPLYVAKKSVEDLKKRFSKNKSIQERMVKGIYENHSELVKEILSKSDHPVFREYVKS